MRPIPTTRPAARPPGRREAAMLGGLAMKRRWQDARRAAGKPVDRPNIVMGINVQVCWEKFARYWDVEPRTVPMEGDRFHLDPDAGRRAVRREHDRRDRRAGLHVRRLVRADREDLQGARRAPGGDRARHPGPRRRRVGRLRRTVPGARPGVGLPPGPGRLDQRLGPQVRPGGAGRGLDHLARRGAPPRGADLPGQLPGRHHADVRAQLLPARRAGGGAVLQLHAPRLRGLPARPAVLARRRAGPRGARSRSSGRSS